MKENKNKKKCKKQNTVEKRKRHWHFFKIQVAWFRAASWNWHIQQQWGISLTEILWESARPGTACAATGL